MYLSVECLLFTFFIIFIFVGVNDLEYQNSTDVCSASWRGFKDTISSLSNYAWRVVTMDTEEEICPWKSYGLHTSASRPVDNSSIDLQGKECSVENNVCERSITLTVSWGK